MQNELIKSSIWRYLLKIDFTPVDTGEFPFSLFHNEMHLPPHWGSLHDMTWLKWKQSYFDPHWRIYICNVCVGVRGICVCTQVSTNLELSSIMGNCGVIGHLCLMDFILLRHIKNGLEPEMGSGVRLCMGKVLGTPRHPLKTITSLQVFLYVFLAWMLV